MRPSSIPGLCITASPLRNAPYSTQDTRSQARTRLEEEFNRNDSQRSDAVRWPVSSHPSTQVEDIEIFVRGKPFPYPVTADGIALDADGGWIYFQEGIFLHSQVETQYGIVRLFNGGVFQYNPRTQRLKVFADCRVGNPWGHMFDPWGQSFFIDKTTHPELFVASSALSSVPTVLSRS